MTTTLETINVVPVAQARARVTITARFDAQTDFTQWVLLDPCTIQYVATGPVDAATVTLVRSLTDPAAAAGPTSVVVATATADPSTVGLAGSYVNGMRAWFRLQNNATFGPADTATERTLRTIAAAINGLQAAPVNDFFAGTTPIPSVVATVPTATTLLLTAAAVGTAGNAIATTETLTNGAFGAATMAGGVNAVAATRVGTFTAAGTAADTITIGTTVYTLVAALTGVANQVLIGGSLTATRNNLVGALMLTGAASTNVLTASANPLADTTCRIGSRTYRFVAAISAASQPYDVLIGAAATNTLDNLIAAVNGTAASVGTLYAAGTAPNTDVSAAAGAGDTIDFTARYSGAASNLIPCTETSAGLSFATAQMAGGTGSGVTWNAATQEVHPTVTAVATSTDQITLTAKTVGTGGNAIATTELGTAFSWAGATLTGGVNAVAATQTLTMSGVFVAANTLTIGAVTYTCRAAPAVANEFLLATTQMNVAMVGERIANV